MAGNKGKKAFRVECKFVSVPEAEFDFEAVTDLLAEAIVRAYVADHPELFQPANNRPRDTGGTDRE